MAALLAVVLLVGGCSDSDGTPSLDAALKRHPAGVVHTFSDGFNVGEVDGGLCTDESAHTEVVLSSSRAHYYAGLAWGLLFAQFNRDA